MDERPKRSQLPLTQKISEFRDLLVDARAWFGASRHHWRLRLREVRAIKKPGKAENADPDPESSPQSSPQSSDEPLLDLIVDFHGHESQIKDMAKCWGMELISSERAVPALSAKQDPDQPVDAKIIEMPPWRRRPSEKSIVFQTFIDEAVTFDPPHEKWIDAHVGKDMRRKLKRAAERGFHVVAGSAQDLDRFHSDFLRPFTLHMHGDGAHIPDVALLRKAMSHGALLFARDGEGRDIGAIFVIYTKNSGARFLRTGIVLDVLKEPKTRDDLTAFLYSAFVGWAMEQGARQGSYGLSVAAARDGLVYYKSRWASRPMPVRRWPKLELEIKTSKVQDWLKKRGVYVFAENGIRVYGESTVPAATVESPK